MAAVRALATLLALTLAACAEPAAPAAPAAGNPFPECAYEPQAPRPGEIVEVLVPMRDCVHLSTHLVAPPVARRTYPVVLIRTPYGNGDVNSAVHTAAGLLFRATDFVVIDQDTRGRHQSEGTPTVIVHEPQDTADTLAWLELQPWFDGRVGVWGLSYLALSAVAAAVERPDLVDAVSVGIMSSDWYTLASHNGALRADGIKFAVDFGTHGQVGVSGELTKRFAEEIQNPDLLDAVHRAGIEDVDVVDIFSGHLYRDGFWRDILDPADFRATNVPVFMQTGWYDFQWRSQVEDYEAILAHRGGPRDLFLDIGPWNHFLGFGGLGDYPFDQPGLGLSGLAASVAFLEYYVAGVGDIGEIPPVRYYDAGTGRWHAQERLWPARTDEWVLYPTAASDGSCPGTLAAAPGAAAVTSYNYDPAEPFELPGVMTISEGGAFVEPAWCGRGDNVVFATPPLVEPIELAGDIELDLDMSTDVGDSSFVARLQIEHADGTVYNLREGVRLLSHRHGDTAPAAYTPGERVTLTVPLPPLRWTLQPGQRLRVGITSSAWPLIAPHPNVGGDWLAAEEFAVARHRFYLGAGAETRLRLAVAGD